MILRVQTFWRLFLKGYSVAVQKVLKRIKVIGTNMYLITMRLKVSILFLAAAVVVCGCQKDHFSEEVEIYDLDFVASVEDFDSVTKTSLSPDNHVVWSLGDRLAIFQGANIADEYQVKDGCAGKTQGTFSIVEDQSGDINGDFSSGMEIPANIAFYPYQNGLECSAGEVSDGESGTISYTITNVNIPAQQVYVPGSFPQGSFPMVAVTSSMQDHNLRFRNVAGALKLQLLGTCSVKSITLSGNKGEKISGEGEVVAYSGTDVPKIRMLEDNGTSITLDCGEDGVQLNTSSPTVFIIAVPPTNFVGGFTVTVTDTDCNKMPVKTYLSNRIRRSSILNMPPIAVPVDGNVIQNIEFEDQLVKELCVEEFDINSDGELSYEEAAVVTGIGRMEINGAITSFNELKYFTSITTIPYSYFFNCTHLEEVTIPESVTSISSNAFYGCNSLKSVNIPEGVTKINKSTFSGCYSLADITIPEGVTEIASDAFGNCESLTCIILPKGITKIERSTFSGCRLLKNIDIPKGVTEIGSTAFQSCRALTEIFIPEGVTSIGDAAFAYCSSLETVTIPDGVLSLGANLFMLCDNLERLYLLSGTLLPYNNYFYNSTDANIYVPADLVDDYKSAQGWSNYESQIYPIPQE